MLKIVIEKIIEECKNSIATLEEMELNLPNAIDYVDITKMKNDFENMLKQIEEKEAKEQEKDDEPVNA